MTDGTVAADVMTTSLDQPMDEWFEEEEIAFEDEKPKGPARMTDAQLEALYDSGTAHIVTQRNDFLIPNLLQSMEDAQYLNLNPPYQRRLRWDNVKKSRLIESLLMNVPIPPVFLFETDLAQYEVMDGQQRLNTIREFFSNDFALVGLEKWSGLNGRRYHRLPPRIQAGLKRRSLAAVILLTESGQLGNNDTQITPAEIKRFVFHRLNTGGVRLNYQEIRNAIYDGPFNHLLHELSREELFTKIWDIPPKEAHEETQASIPLRSNRFYRQLLDCEIVLRFFTLQSPGSLTTSMRRSLDDTMARFHASPGQNLEPLRQDFRDSLAIAYDVYGASTFRLAEHESGGHRARGAPSRALYDAVMLGIYSLLKGKPSNERAEIRSRLVANKSKIIEETQGILKTPRFYQLLVGRLNTKQSIIDRIDLMQQVFARAAQA